MREEDKKLFTNGLALATFLAPDENSAVSAFTSALANLDVAVQMEDRRHKERKQAKGEWETFIYLERGPLLQWLILREVLPHELEQVMDMITVNAARAARVSDYGIAPGMRADLIVVDAPSLHEALRLQPPRAVILLGRRGCGLPATRAANADPARAATRMMP